MENKVKKETMNEIDNLSNQIKKSTRNILNACTENTAEVVSDLFDNFVNKIKQRKK